MALTSNQWLLMLIASHLVISAQVTARSWLSEFAEMIVVEPIRVDSIQIVSQLTRADLPIPRPDDTAWRSVSKSTSPCCLLICAAISRSTSRCHLRGPLKFASGVFSWPQGNANNTNASGSSAIAGDHRVVISSCSSSGL